MNPVLRVAVFLLTMTSVMIGAHYYLYSRWVRPFSNTARTRRISFAVAGIGLLTMVSAIYLSRKLEGTEWVTPLAYLGFGYMGVLFIAMVVTAGIHAFRAIYFFALTELPPLEHASIDLNRRHFFNTNGRRDLYGYYDGCVCKVVPSSVHGMTKSVRCAH